MILRYTTALFAALLLTFGLNSSFSQAQELIHYFNFNDNLPESNTNWDQPILATSGDAELTYTFSEAFSFGGTTINGINNEISGGSLAPRGEQNNGEFFLITAPTTGFEDIILSYATQRTGTGFNSQLIEYTIDGQSWIELTTNTDIPSSFDSRSFNFSSVLDANNNPSFVIRITLDGATSSAGNNRFDNIRLEGSPTNGVDPDPVAQTPSFSPTGSEFQDEITVSLSVTDGSTIFYSTDASATKEEFLSYSAPLTFTETTTLRAFAAQDEFDDSPIVSQTYTLTEPPAPIAAAPVFTPPASEGPFEEQVSVEMSTETSGGVIYYTTNGATPTEDSEVYSGTILLTSTSVLRAITFADGFDSSTVTTQTYQIVPAAIEDIVTQFTFTGNTTAPSFVEAGLDVSDMSLSAGNVSFGTAQANTWLGSGVPYAEGSGGWNATSSTDAKHFLFTVQPNNGTTIQISELELQHRATGAGPSAMTIFINGNEITTINMPNSETRLLRIENLNLSFEESFEVKIAGWDNDSRTTTGNGAFRVNDVTLGGTVLSDGIAQTPVFDPTGGEFQEEVTVSLSVTDGSEILFSTDIDAAKEDFTTYTDPLTFTETTSLRAFAAQDGFADSPIITETYTISTGPEEVSTIAVLQSKANDGNTYLFTGQAVVTFVQDFRNQIFIQDETGGILIDDAPSGNFNPGVITTEYVAGDVLSGMTGTVTVFGNMIQFVPSSDPGEPVETDVEPSPIVITLADLYNDFSLYRSVLVEVSDVLFSNPDGNFANGQVYGIEASNSEAEGSFRTTFFDVDYIGSEIPSGSYNITGIPNSRTGSNQPGDFLTARSLADFELVDGDDPDPIVEAPVFNPSPDEGPFTEPFDLVMTSETEGASIFYTLNGDVPSQEDELFTGSILISETTTVSARAFTDGLDPSNVVVGMFEFQEAPAEEILVQYSFTGEVLNPTILADGFTASDFGVSAGSIVFGSAQATSWSGSGVPYAQASGGWGSATVEDAKYFVFTVSPEGTGVTAVDAVEFQYRATGAGPSAITVWVDGIEVATFDAPANETTSFSVSDLNINASDSFEIRVYGWDNGSRTTSGNGDFRINDVILIGTFETVAVAQTPTFNPDGGTFVESVEVTLSTDDGSSIFFTANADAETGEFESYTEPFTITETSTIRAFASLEGSADSPIVSRTFVITEDTENQVNTIAELLTKVDDGEIYTYTGEAIVTFSQSFRNQRFIQDETGAILIDDILNTLDGQFTRGDVITGITGNVTVFNNTIQFVPSELSGTKVDDGQEADPIEISLEDLYQNFSTYRSALVSVTNVRFSNTGGNFANAQLYALEDADDVSITGQFRTSFLNVDYIGSAILPVTYTITGIPNSRTGSNQPGDFLTARDSNDFFQTSDDPLLSVSPTEIVGLDYFEGFGPSASSIIEITGSDLLESTVSVNTTENVEVSADGESFSNSLTLNVEDGSIEFVILARLRSGLSQGSYQEVVTVSGGGAEAVTTTVSGSVEDGSDIPLLGTTPYRQNFSGFNSFETLPAGWIVTNENYVGDWGSGTGGGLRGNQNVLGFQHTGSTGVFTSTLTLINDTGETIEELSIGYLGRVARADQTRFPEWTVTVNGEEVEELFYSTGEGVDQPRNTLLTGLEIQQGQLITIQWSSDRGFNDSGASRQIGIGNVVISATDEELIANIQLIHNAADPALSMIDVYVNGDLEIEGVSHPSATSFMEVPAGMPLTFSIVPAGAALSEAIFEEDVTLEADENYYFIARGVANTADFSPNPDGLNTAFNVDVVAGARTSSENDFEVDLILYHGVTDAPAVDVRLLNGALIDEDLAFGSFSNFASLAPDTYFLEVNATLTGDRLFVFEVDASTLTGGAGVVMASGFVDPAQNQNGDAFTLYVVLPNGEILPVRNATSSSEDQIDLPEGITLEQNYPNPFNPTTQIRYSLPESTPVTLEVFTVAGQRVATLVNTTQSAGTHTATFDAASLSSGVYLYRLQAGDTILTKKMMLVK